LKAPPDARPDSLARFIGIGTGTTVSLGHNNN